MKSTHGIVWLPILIMVAAVAAFASTAYLAFQSSKSQDDAAMTNILVNNPSVNSANIANSVSNRNTAVTANNNTNLPVNESTAINSNSANTNTTADRLTYTNAEYGFSFQYQAVVTPALSQTQYNGNTFQHLNFSDTTKTYGYWMMFRSAPGYTDAISALVGLYGFSSDLPDVLTQKDDVVIDGHIAKNYCGIPGNSPYCSMIFLNDGNFFQFNYYEDDTYYPEPAPFPSDILSTFRFTE